MKMNKLVFISSLAFLPFAENVGNSSGYLLDRKRRDYDHGDYHVKCKSSNTGKGSSVNDVTFILYTRAFSWIHTFLYYH